MRIFRVLLSCAVVTGCAPSTGGYAPFAANGAPAFAQRPHSAGDQVLHRFTGGTDGAEVEGSPILVNGTLYGTTLFGGTKGCGPFANGCGIVYKVGIDGTGYRVLYRFKGGTDGEIPQGALLVVNGKLYGTTSNGGAGSCAISKTVIGCGTVFSIDESGAGYQVLHRFHGKGDGAVPLFASLLLANGTLYGTTAQGGSSACGGTGCGTVFRIGTTGTGYNRMYAFKGGATDGALPYFGLIDVNGMLYGTTSAGGGTGCGGSGCGSIFSISTAGNETMLRALKGGTDSANPDALTDVNGTIYATAYAGGGSGCGGAGCGTVFKIGVSGAGYRVLYRFKGAGDGGEANALIAVGSTLYGTAQIGGGSGQGTVFSISLSGAKTPLYSFAGGSDGSYPTTVDGLAGAGSALYGTTYAGGGSGCKTKYSTGCGTVFAVDR